MQSQAKQRAVEALTEYAATVNPQCHFNLAELDEDQIYNARSTAYREVLLALDALEYGG